MRLTQHTRKVIRERLITYRFGKETEELLRERAALADRIYQDLYSPDIQAKMAELGGDAFIYREAFSLEIGGEYYTATMTKPRPMMYAHYRGACKSYEPTHPLAVEVVRYDTRADRLSEAERVARSEVSAALQRVNTVDQLLTMWPDAAPFVQDLVPSAPTTALAIPIKTLNELLGLPKAD